MTTYIDFPIGGPLEAVADFISAFGENAVVIGPRELDGIAYALVRFDEDYDFPDLPEGIAFRPETVAAVCGAFMSDPEPVDYVPSEDEPITEDGV